MERKLVTIETVRGVQPHPNADRLELARVRNWQVVVKKREFQKGDPCFYFEIDSLIPGRDDRFKFLEAYAKHKPTGGYRIRTAKLRGEISQGLILPLETFPEVTGNVGDDVTEQFGVEKYIPDVPQTMQGMARSFDWPIPKTDEERLENLPDWFLQKITEVPCYATMKIDGTSASYILSPDGDYHVCSRNLSLQEEDRNVYWKMEKKYQIRKFLIDNNLLALQGEIAGPGIQKNPLGLEELELFVFNAYRMDGSKVPYPKLWSAVPAIRKVPLLWERQLLMKELENPIGLVENVRYSDNFPNAKKKIAEGIVVRAYDQSWSFKYVNPEYLL